MTATQNHSFAVSEPRVSGRPTAAVLAGVGSWLPERIVTNDDLAQVMDTSDDWIRTRTGIAERRRAAPGEATSDMAVEAAKRALQSSGDEQADAVIVATTTPDYALPATAPDVAARLGLAGVAAFDVAAVCTGFIYALSTAAGLIAAGTAKRVVVVGADVYSTIINPTDRTTAILFGDGAGAVVLQAGDHEEPGALGPTILGSDGGNKHLIQIPGGGSRQRGSQDDAQPGGEFFAMHGSDVFIHALKRMTQASTSALAAAHWSIEDVDRLAAHQANKRILRAVADNLGLPAEKQLSNIFRVGNTSAASIPLLLDHSVKDGRLRAGNKLLMTAFGGGLTWGATTVTWPSLSSAV